MRNILAVALLFICGCAAHPIHPGTANKFDSDSYDALLVTASVIESTKADLAANKFSPTLAPKVKTALNDLIKGYDDADLFYCGTPVGASCAPMSYHALALAGQATPAMNTKLTQLQNIVTAAVNALAAAKAGN